MHNKNLYQKVTLLLFVLLALACENKGLDSANIIFVAQNGGIVPQEIIPHKQEGVSLEKGNIYGWQLYVDSDQPVSWKEEVILPALPKFWDGKEAASKTYITEKTSVPKKVQGKYMVSNSWSVAEGDPAGNYIFNVYVDDKRIKQFNIAFK